MADNDDEFPDFFPEIDQPASKLPGKSTNSGRTAQELLPRALIESVIGMPGIASIRQRQGFCLVVQAPGFDWVAPLSQCLKTIGRWNFHHTKTGAGLRRSTTDDTASEQLMQTMSSGGRAFGVSPDLRLLPAAMIAAADRTIVLPPPSSRVIGAVIRAVTGKKPRSMPDHIGVGLQFDEIASCIRPGSTPAECVARLQNASESKRTVDNGTADAPHLGELHGYGAAQQWGLNLIEDLDAWRRGEIPFESISAHVVLASAPGLGKTSFMRSLARSTGLPLVPTSVGQWFADGAGYLDSVIKQIDLAFATARASAPAILFLDEVEAVPNRATMTARAAEWWTPVVTHLLTKLDGAVSGSTTNLVIVGATNFADKLDAALVRPGRLSRIIHIDPPDEAALAGIFRQHLGNDLLGQDLGDAARLAFGSSGATVVDYVKTARRTARTAKRPMLLIDLLDAIAPPDDRSVDLVRRVAVHEAGHAAIAHAVGLGRVQSVSIVAQGRAGGFTFVDRDDRVPTRDVMEKIVVQALGGRAAEEVVLGSAGTGSGGHAQSDLAVATRSLGLLHLGLGLGDSLIYRADPETVPDVLARDARIAAMVEADLQRLYVDAMVIAQRNLPLIEALAAELIERRHIGSGRFLEIVDEVLGARRPKVIKNG